MQARLTFRPVLRPLAVDLRPRAAVRRRVLAAGHTAAWVARYAMTGTALGAGLGLLLAALTADFAAVGTRTAEGLLVGLVVGCYVGIVSLRAGAEQFS